MSTSPDTPTPKSTGTTSEGRRVIRLMASAALVAAVLAGAITALLVNIMQHKVEAQNPFYRVVAIDDTIADPAVWGKNFPMQFDAYLRTTEQASTKFAGSEAIVHKPTGADPRTAVSRSKLDEDPRLRDMWAGYAFAHDYRERRGHAYMLEDQVYTERQRVKKQPGTCIHCHASVYTAYKELGQGDLTRGFEKLNAMPYAEARTHVKHAVACIDCHDPSTMALRITRPAFMEGIRALKASQGVKDYDVNRQATRQEMRSYVCAQCHVEYHFKGQEQRLVFPWGKGLKVEEILATYDESGFSDWTHQITGARVLKAQHPEFETWSQGIHGRSGVSCADCHMPYKREGALKVSDHHVRSPLLNINRSCQTCHKWPEQELKARVELIQERTVDMRNVAQDALADLIREIAAAQKAGTPDADLAQARDFQRKAQFGIDFVHAENSVGFHAPQETARVLARAIDACRKGQMSLRPASPTRSP